MDLQQKIMDCFIGKVVRKDLAFLVKGGLPVPTYVLEYLLGQYCASDDEEVINEGIEKVKLVIQNNYVHRAETLTNSHLFESIPTSFIKGAFIDRMHLYNPGWEIKMLKKNSFSKGYGLITDYIAAVLHEKLSRFSLSRCSQKNRRCKAFNVSITKTEE